MSKKLTIFSWALYDFANTIFAMNIISLHFALWVTVDKQGEDIFYSLALSISMILIAISMPVIGAISDRYKRRMPFLISGTLLCVCFTALIGVVDKLIYGLLFFGIANVGYQIGMMFYNALLSEISNKENIGKISGLGIGLGYVGSITGLLMVKPFVDYGGRSWAFIPTAILFLLFALPCFIFVKDKYKEQITKFRPGIKDAFLRLKQTFLHSKQYPGLITFLIANFIYLDAVNTIILFMGVYAKKVISLSETELVAFLVTSTIFAIMGSFSVGFVIDKIGSKKTLTLVIGLFTGIILFAGFSFNKYIFWFVGPVAGICMGSVWTTARTLMVDLSPPEKVGEFFGLYSLTGKFASVLGPMVWGLVVFIFGFLGMLKYRLAVLSLLIFFITGFIILQRIPDTKGK
ncbi:MAG: MFS transporter [bacterium]